MREDVEEFQKRYHHCMLSGDLDCLVGLYRPPVLVFFPDRRRIDATSAEITRGMQAMLDGIKKLGVASADYHIHDVESRPGTGTIAYRIEVRLYDAAGVCLRESRSKRYLERTDQGLMLTMVDLEVQAIDIAPHNGAVPTMQ